MRQVGKARQKHWRLTELAALPGNLMEGFPEEQTQDDTDYQEIIRRLQEEQRRLENGMNQRYGDMVEYYTVWAHQIKTPIAAMKLTLQNEDSALSRRLSEELFRIEQYVEMVLTFLRLDSASTDYVFREYNLDDLIRQAARKFSTQFINKKIRLLYEPAPVRVVTDEKWLLFVVEQVLSNAVKYTPSNGGILLEIRETPSGQEGTAQYEFMVTDTGIGMKQEFLERIFEPFERAEDEKIQAIQGTGLGLSICKSIAELMSGDITVDDLSSVTMTLQNERSLVWEHHERNGQRQVALDGNQHGAFPETPM